MGTMTGKDDLIERLFAYWFGADPTAVEPEAREVWFKTDPAFDAGIAEEFANDAELALAGDYDALTDSARGCLALVLMLDQFPRNLHRGTARAFAGDARARSVARHALEKGYDRQLPPAARMFLYLPFEHSEDIADQNLSVELFEPLGNERWNDYAVRHRDIVQRFGRFPHRNAALGRESTPEEIAFLEEPNSSF